MKQACVFDGLGIGASLPVFKALAPTGKVGDVGDLLRDVAHNVINTPDGVFWPMECARPFCANELNWAWGRLTSACATLGRGKAVLMLNLWRLDMTYLGKTPGEGIVSDRIGFDLSGVSVTGKMEFAEPEV